MDLEQVMNVPRVKYGWQRYVLEAELEPKPHLSRQKATRARKVIADRRLEMIDEAVALEEANHTLGVLEKDS